MGRLHHSTGVASAILLLVVGYSSVSDARPVEKRAKPVAAQVGSEQSIHTALTESSTTRTQVLLDRGANIEARNARGATPLITAAGRGNLPLVLLLLSQGAQVAAQDHDGNTPLHEASFQSHLPCVEALLTAGAQTTIRNELGFTPLHQAVRRFWEMNGESHADRLSRQTAVIHRLLRSGADPQSQDTNGRTPVVLAKESDNATLQQAFRTASVDTTPATDTPTPRRAAGEESGDSSQPLTAAPPHPNSSAVLSPAEVSVFSLPPHQPREAPAVALPAQSSPDAPTPAGSPSTRLPEHRPDASADSWVASLPVAGGHPGETSAPARTSTAPLASPNPPSTDTHSIPAAEPTAAEPPVPPNRESPPPHALQPATQQVSDKPPTTIPEPIQPLSSSVPPEKRQSDSDSTGRTDPSPTVTTADSAVTIVSPPSVRDHRERVSQPTEREGTSAPAALALSTSPVENKPGHPALPLTPSSQATETGSSPTLRQSSPSLYGRQEEPEPVAEDPPHPSLFQNVGFGLGLGWTHNLGARRVESVSVTNRIVRIDDERNDLVRAMPEVHLWIDRWDEQRWSWGPFLAVAPGSRIIDAVGGGLMVGYRPQRSDQYSFNFGIGGILDLDTQVLGDGLVANEPLPPRETSARTKHTTGAGLLVLFSVGWDLSAPRQVSPPGRK